MDRNLTCCFTGHRPQSLPFGFNEEDVRCKALKQLLLENIVELTERHGITRYISGLALGIDQIASEIVLMLKKMYPEITLEGAIPCKTQAIKWTEVQRKRYENIISGCDITTVLSDEYYDGCMQARNRYMVDKSDYILGVWDGRTGGTGSTIKYAQSKGKQIIIINPREL